MLLFPRALVAKSIEWVPHSALKGRLKIYESKTNRRPLHTNSSASSSINKCLGLNGRRHMTWEVGTGSRLVV